MYTILKWILIANALNIHTPLWKVYHKRSAVEVLIPSGFVRYSLIAFAERVTFWLIASGHCLVRVRMLHYLHVGLRITITQSHTHSMQQTHTLKVVTQRVEAKKLLSRRRQSNYRCLHLKFLHPLMKEFSKMLHTECVTVK